MGGCLYRFARSLKLSAVILMFGVEIDYVVSDPKDRKPSKVIVRSAGTENVIYKSDVAGRITDDMVKSWLMCGLTDEAIKRIVGYLRS